MDKPYKAILIISFFLMISMLGLLASQTDQSIIQLIFVGLVMFVVFGLCFGMFYYFVRKENGYYKEILIFSSCLTAFLFAMDYMFWDKDPPNPSAKRILFESVVIGTAYTGVFFSFVSALFYTIRMTGQFISKRATKQPIERDASEM